MDEGLWDYLLTHQLPLLHVLLQNVLAVLGRVLDSSPDWSEEPASLLGSSRGSFLRDYVGLWLRFLRCNRGIDKVAIARSDIRLLG